MKLKIIKRLIRMVFGGALSIVLLTSFINIQFEKVYDQLTLEKFQAIKSNWDTTSDLNIFDFKNVDGELCFTEEVTEYWVLCEVINGSGNENARKIDGNNWYRIRKIPAKKSCKFKFKAIDLFHEKNLCMLPLASIANSQRKKPNRIVLINVEESGTEYASHGQSWGHLGLLHVGTVAEQEGFEVVLWDELILNQAQLENLILPGDVVGLSVVVTGITRAQRYAIEAKKLGASFVLCGNDQASFRVPQILQNKAIDGVFVGDDLAPMRKVFRNILVEGTIPDIEIPGFVRRGSQAISRDLRNDTEYFVIPNLSLYSQGYWEKVWENHRRLNGFEYKNPQGLKNSLILLAGGCSRGSNTCTYCSIYDVWNVRKSDNEHIQKLITAYQNFGINDFYSVADSMYEMTASLKQIKASGLKLPNLILYARSQGIAQNPKNIQLLQEIVEPGGVLKFNIGLDTGDDWVLRNGIEKGHGMDLQYKAIQHIKDAGIHLHCSFIFGSPGESHDSCKRTFDFIQYITDALGHNLIQVESDVWWVNFGAPCAKVFLDYHYACMLASKAGKTISFQEWFDHFGSKRNELFVPLKSEKAWYHFFTNITLEEAEEYRTQTEMFMRNHGLLTGRAFFTSPEG